MVDDSELDYLITWLTAATTDVTVKSIETTRNISLVGAAKRALIFPPETMWINGAFYKKRYLIKVSAESEANHMAIVNDIIDGCLAYNKNPTVATMCNINYAYGGRCFVEINGRWNQDLWIDVEWITS